MKQLIFLFLLYTCSSLVAQNVGIGTASPLEKLDVNGNINVTGTIKANGTDGTANQVLMKNSSGNLAWGDLCDYKTFVSFQYTSSMATQTWTVPAGTTKIMVELWGGGSGANASGGGGGGGAYARALLTVTPASQVNIIVGGGGIPGSGGEASDVNYGSTYIDAGGGFNPSSTSPGLGGMVLVSPATFKNYTGISGQSGESTDVNVTDAAGGSFYFRYKYGRGGNAGNTADTGGSGGIYFYRSGGPFTTYINNLGMGGGIPGGGGGGDGLGSRNGGNGMVIIHY
ncbi:MAG: hypothetical protein U0V75_09040 [Ferruginibacter sp.]